MTTKQLSNIAGVKYLIYQKKCKKAKILHLCKLTESRL